MIEIVKTPAKINVFLKITGIDTARSLHFLETLIIPINIYDTIYISKAEKIFVETKGIDEIIPSESNIICKIFREVERFLNRSLPGFNVVVEKTIPTGAGLGGGSTNGAGFLLFLNRHLDLGLSLDNMVDIASKVGSDIPVFLFNSPAIVTGTGQLIEPVKITKPDFFMLLIYPDIIVNTGIAYALFDKKKLTKSTGLNINSVRKRVNGSLKDWNSVFFNDFEGVVFENWPHLKELKHSLENCGADTVFMSGSGSSLVAVFNSEELRDRAYDNYFGKYRTVEKIELLTGNGASSSGKTPDFGSGIRGFESSRPNQKHNTLEDPNENN